MSAPGPTRCETAAVHDALVGRRYRPVNEACVQRDVASALDAAGLSAQAEYRLTRHDRPDFLVCGQIAVEVKIRGSRNDTLRQLARYAHHPDVVAVVLATKSRRLATQMPTSLSGKPLQVTVLPGVLL